MDLYQSTDTQNQRDNRFASAEVAQSTGSQQNTYLDVNQQDLLLAALNSQANGRQNTPSQADGGGASFQGLQQPPQATMNGVAAADGNGVFISPTEAEFDNFGDYTPELDYLDDGFDFENADLGGEMIGALPGAGDSNEDLTGTHEKRKNPDGKDDGGDAKRQETENGEKGAKKPGRKPLTSEPTTKRKAQNRAAQRAFRERKEKHVKDLETKVSELTKTQEADKHENGLLKAQIERLQIELREYRKRLSLNGGRGNGSPPLTASGQSRSNSNQAYSNGTSFQFDFPKFGALPGSQIFGNALANGSSSSNRTSATPPLVQSPTGSISGPSQTVSSRENSMQARSMSPRSASGSNTNSPGQMSNLNPSFAPYSTNTNMHGFASTLPQMANTNSNDPFGDLFSPSILKGTAMGGTGNYFGGGNAQLNGVNLNGVSDPSAGGDSTAGLNRVFQFNGGSTSSDTASPSGSSQWNANANSSSCGTSPEPSHDTPAQKSADSFCDKIDPRKNSTDVNVTNQTNTNQFANANGDYSVPSLDSFDPVLFGDYRESNDAIVGGGDFTGGFFDEALNPVPFDYASPTNLFGILQSPQQTNASLSVPSTGAANAPSPSKNLMADMDKIRDGGDDDYGLPSSKAKKVEGSGKLISCNSIWNQLQSNPDFQDGKFDLDGLCSELRAKARCSESGVMVDQDHVDAALRKLGNKNEDGKGGLVGLVRENPFDAQHQLMFEQESWDNVLRKMGGGGA